MLVEQQLGRRTPRSTVKGALATNPAFERVGYGRYRRAYKTRPLVIDDQV